MDLEKFDFTAHASNGADMHVVHPITEEPMYHDGKPVIITLIGSDAAVLRDEMKRRARLQMRKAKDPNKREDVDFDEVEKTSAEIIALATQSWYGLTQDGEEIPFSREKAIELYMKYPWLRQQCDTFVAERSNFYKA